jgi:hypothetical protein
MNNVTNQSVEAEQTCQIKCSLTVDEFTAVVEKIIDVLPASLEDEWLTGLEDTTDFPPIPEEDEEVFRHAFWQAVRIAFEGLVKYGLIAEPLIASIEVITGADRATIEACATDPGRQCLLRAVSGLKETCTEVKEAT